MMFQIQEEKEKDFILNQLSQSLDTFGEVKLSTDNNSRSARYVKVTPSVNIEKLKQLFLDHWLILQADLLVCITGSTEKERVEYWEKLFYETFFKDAHTTVAITNGIQDQLTKALGNAMKFRWNQPSCKSSLLGIPFWHQIYNKDQLVGTMNEGKYPATYTKLRENEITDGDEMPLAENHEYYVMLDAKNCSKSYETRVGIISALRENIANTWVPEFWTERTGLKTVPSLHLVIGGDVVTLMEVNALLQNHQIVALVNCRGATGLLCMALNKLRNSNLQSLDKEFVEAVVTKQGSWLTGVSQQSIIIDYFMKILDKSDLVHIIDPDHFKEDFYSLVIKLHGKTESLVHSLRQLYHQFS
ncbi:Transient receptor potential cation channel subfamily M member 7 [Trichoplax sp. H2]|nr:Transient receptor potential cation channel subfamily M member 7 [Trichoplax sp. H2]|eukprot:RDD43172.1 Transient receptor potential cation channel subfamily M member 7 [Trichoplax sp. H2]